MDARPAAGLPGAGRGSARRSTQYKVCSTFDSSPAGRLDRAGDRPRRRRSSAAPWHPLVVGGAGMRPLPGLRQPVRGGGRRRLPARPAPDDGAPPGDADGRGRPAAPPGTADRAPDRARRLRRHEAGRGGRARSRASAAAGAEVVALDVLDERDAGRGGAADLGAPRRAAVRDRLAGPEAGAGGVLAGGRADPGGAGDVPRRGGRSGSPASRARARRSRPARSRTRSSRLRAIPLDARAPSTRRPGGASWRGRPSGRWRRWPRAATRSSSRPGARTTRRSRRCARRSRPRGRGRGGQRPDRRRAGAGPRPGGARGRADGGR